MVDDRGDDREHDAAFDAQNDHAAAVSRATTNSWRRTVRRRRIPRTSMSSTAIRKTTAARAAIGR
jgi:hypothetical protein